MFRAMFQKPPYPTVATLLVPLLATALLAGCMGIGDGGDTTSRNQAPRATLNVTPNEGWTGDTVTFDATQSQDDGRIVRYAFDFGDGSRIETGESEEPRVQHIYTEGGFYTVTLTVTDDGAEDAGALTDTDSVDVAVNEREPVAARVIEVGGNTTNASQYEQPFDAGNGSRSFELDVEARSLLVAGSSEAKVEVLDPDEEVLASDTVNLEPNEPQRVLLEGALAEAGEYTIRFTAESGGASFDGEVRIFYGEGGAMDTGTTTPTTTGTPAP